MNPSKMRGRYIILIIRILKNIDAAFQKIASK
jgi:hypothetical protein